MRPHDDPAAMTADERLHEVALILAAGILRLRYRAALSTDPDPDSGSKNLPESGQRCLEVSGETVLSGTTGVNGFRDQTERNNA